MNTENLCILNGLCMFDNELATHPKINELKILYYQQDDYKKNDLEFSKKFNKVSISNPIQEHIEIRAYPDRREEKTIWKTTPRITNSRVCATINMNLWYEIMDKLKESGIEFEPEYVKFGDPRIDKKFERMLETIGYSHVFIKELKYQMNNLEQIIEEIYMYINEIEQWNPSEDELNNYRKIYQYYLRDRNIIRGIRKGEIMKIENPLIMQQRCIIISKRHLLD